MKKSISTLLMALSLVLASCSGGSGGGGGGGGGCGTARRRCLEREVGRYVCRQSQRSFQCVSRAE
mgnify:CR=1 FL=1